MTIFQFNLRELFMNFTKTDYYKFKNLFKDNFIIN